MSEKNTKGFAEVVDWVIDKDGNKDLMNKIMTNPNYTAGFLNDLFSALVSNEPDWEWKYVAKIDKEIYLSGDKESFKNKILYPNEVQMLTGEREAAAMLTPENTIGHLYRTIDNADMLKIIEFRLLSPDYFRADYIREGTSVYNVREAIREIRKNRNTYEGHQANDADKDTESVDDRTVFNTLESLIVVLKDALPQTAGLKVKSRECAEIFENFIEKLTVLTEAFDLVKNGREIAKNESAVYNWRDIYAYDIFVAYPSFENKYLRRFISALKENRKEVLLDNGTVEYTSHIKTGRNEALKPEASDFLKMWEFSYEHEKHHESITVVREGDSINNYSHYTDPFFSFISSRKPSEKICVITDNAFLARRIWALNNPNIVAVKIISSDSVSPFLGEPQKHEEPSEQVLSFASPSFTVPIKDKPVPPAEPEKSAPTAYNSRQESFPDTDNLDYVLINNEEHYLKGIISSGGEGTVYATPYSHRCVKLYSKPTAERCSKLEQMVNSGISFRESEGTICWPLAVVRHPIKPHPIIGFQMARAKNAISLEELKNQINTNENTWGWKRSDLVDLCRNIAALFMELHRQVDANGEPRVLMGDINDKNILVTKEKQVFFIDTDSYQFDDLKCTVGRPEYSSPRLHNNGCKYRKVKRNIQDERFAIANLMFFTLFLGDTPYSVDADYSLRDCIKRKRYKFYREDIRDSRENYILRNLSENVKKAFQDVFYSSDRMDHPEMYPDDQRWYNILDDMYRQITGKRLSNEIHPTAALNSETDGFEGAKCIKCGKIFESTKETDSSVEESQICPECKSVRDFNRAIIYRLYCNRCGKHFTVNLWDICEDGSASADALCPDCGRMKVPKSWKFNEDPKELLKYAIANAADYDED